MTENDVVSRTFRALVESADRKFARVRDVPAYGRVHNQHYFQKVFKAYMRLWKFQQENRSRLVESGLNRWEIGEIASRIGQLYFGQYMRTSEARFLVEAYVFYEAILNRRYFEGSKLGLGKDLGVRFKELRFYARFLMVSFILSRTEMVNHLLDRFKALVDDSKANFRDTNFKEWRQVVQEIVRFMKVDTSFMNARPLRYCATFDSHPASLSYVTRFHAKKVLKFQDALLTSYHRNEVKFAELTLDTFRMLQCLEWEPTGSFYQKRPAEPKENGSFADHSGASGLIDINLAADMTDPTLPPNPRKAILYRPFVTHLIAVMATICEELPPDSVMLVYLSASGKVGRNVASTECSGGSQKFSRNKAVCLHEHSGTLPVSSVIEKGESSSGFYDKYLWFGPRGNCGINNLYPGDIIPFTRRPLFLIIDSDNSHAFKAVRIFSVAKFESWIFSELTSMVLHGAERGEPAALLLSPLKPSFKNPSDMDIAQSGSQFTFFLTAPLPSFCQLVGFSNPDTEADVYNEAEDILSTAFSEWEVILLTSTSLDLVWAQVLSDPFLRRLILRFIFCRSVLSFFCPPEDREQCLPTCLPSLPNSLSPDSEVVKAAVLRLAKHLRVVDCFHFDDT
ncbi:Protein SCAI [Trema orientale]|uniref:Protein SCAI n=1 Tax=Trema orientale TaxID=63057 RepID=A0A2P5EZD4_TREOI|nr:Protein SCAI [Trema orientale]